MKNNVAAYSAHAILEVPSSGGSAHSNPPQHAFGSSKSYCMSFQGHDIKGNFIFVAAGATLLATVACVIRHFFRTFTLRKDPPVDFLKPYGASGVAVADSAQSASTGPAPIIAPSSIPEPAPGLHSGEITQVTSPIDPSEAPQHVRVLASEGLLSKDWDSQEDDKAWASL